MTEDRIKKLVSQEAILVGHVIISLNYRKKWLQQDFE